MRSVRAGPRGPICLRNVEVGLESNVILNSAKCFVDDGRPTGGQERNNDCDEDNDCHDDGDGLPSRFHDFGAAEFPQFPLSK